jgi:hypothetical protein
MEKAVYYKQMFVRYAGERRHNTLMSEPKQLNVWIDGDLKDALSARAEREGKKLKELVEHILRQDVARERGEIIEQQSLPVISEILESKLRKVTAQLRHDLREDMQLEVIQQIKTITRNSDNRLAGLIVRDAGIIRRMLYALVAKTHGTDFASEAYESAREKAGQELSSRAMAKKEAD